MKLNLRTVISTCMALVVNAWLATLSERLYIRGARPYVHKESLSAYVKQCLAADPALDPEQAPAATDLVWPQAWDPDAS